MHRLNHPLGILSALFCCIGILCVSFTSKAEEPDPERLARENKVYVEPSYISTTAVNGEYRLIPYAERRGRWGTTVGLSYESYEPREYEPNYANETYDGLYGSPSLPFIELQFTVKRNFSSGSLGLELGVAQFQNGSADKNFVDSELTLTPIRLGVVYALDNLGAEPYWAPFVSAGAYIIMYKEVLGENSFNGNSQVAPYFTGGIAFPLDWIDRRGARRAYEESGIERSYFVVDGRMLMASSSEQDPDFSSSFHWGAGLRVEF